jgi:hypothetical protein
MPRIDDHDGAAGGSWRRIDAVGCGGRELDADAAVRAIAGGSPARRSKDEQRCRGGH